MQKNLSLALSLVLTAALTACGGGGGGGDEPVASGPTSKVQGRWATAAVSTPAYTAVGLPAGNASAVVWVLANDASRLAKVTVQDNGTLAGKAYTLGQNTTAAAITGQWSVPSSQSINLTGVVNSTLAFSQTDALTTPAVQADAAGTWQATIGGNARTVTWVIAASGALSGSSTTGCSYTGNMAAMANASAYIATVKEACPDGVATQFNGIATLNPAKNALSMVASSADESVGVALFLSK